MKRIQLYSVITLFAMMFSACDGYLDVLPQNNQAQSNFWQNKEEVDAVVSSTYLTLRNNITRIIELGELRGGSIYETTSNNLQTFRLVPTDKYAEWSGFYSIILPANSIIKNAEGVMAVDETFTEQALNSYLAEAYFLRSLAYFYIARNWKEAPFITTPYETDETTFNMPATSNTMIMSQIRADLEAVLATGAVKETYEEDWETKGRATKWAINALLADICLWQEDYTAALKYCDAILGSSSAFRPVFIEDPSQWMEKIFYEGNSNESIFELNFDSDYTQNNSLYSYFGLTQSRMYSPQMTNDFIDETLETGIENSVRALYGGFTVTASSQSQEVSLDDLYNAQYGYVWKYTGAGYRSNTGRSSSSSDIDGNFIVYRVAEVMLMKAEALILQGNDAANWQEAIDIFNAIRERSNLVPYSVSVNSITELEMLNALLYERNVELAGEAKRWYDLLRIGSIKGGVYQSQVLINQVTLYNPVASVSWVSSVLTDENAHYLPISQSEIESNPELIQNPYYGSIN